MFFCVLGDQSQSNLGWPNLLKGSCSIHWRRLQNEFFVDNFYPKLVDKLGVLSSLRSCVNSVHAIWKLHNTQHHCADNEFQQSELPHQTIETIVDLYDLRDCVLPCDKHLFHPSLDDHLSKLQSSLHAWVTNHSEQLFHSHQQAIKDNVTHTNSLTSYSPLLRAALLILSISFFGWEV